ncbi:MAG: glycosyltransferase family 4 protein [Acidobacteriota bacterium]|nr:glycosyltransferase family 4 protein [Acidobacteriota bacterium]
MPDAHGRGLRLLHLSPTWFDRDSVVGGAERYAWELARAAAAESRTTFLSFGPTPQAREDSGVRVRILRSLPVSNPVLAPNPLGPALMREIASADVIHCHQADTLLTNAAIVLGRALGKRVFVSDLGGGHMHAPSTRIGVLNHASGMLLLSAYSKQLWEEAPAWRRPARLEVVYGGVDLTRFTPSAERVANQVVFVGRLMRHKGVEHVISAIEPPLRLIVAGRPYDAAYVDMLKATAAGRDVEFQHDVSDDQLPALYGRSLATVMPSVYDTWGGGSTLIPELLGLVALESMACGTPAIVSSVASLPELVEDGVTGFIVPPNDPAAIGRALGRLVSEPGLRDEMGRRARAAIEARFTWDAVAARCLRAYTA